MAGQALFVNIVFSFIDMAGTALWSLCQMCC